jgi:hypothetical protein
MIKSPGSAATSRQSKTRRQRPDLALRVRAAWAACRTSNANIAIVDLDPIDLIDVEKLLRSFDESEAKWAADFAKLVRALVAPGVREYLCIIQPFEDVTALSLNAFKERTVEFQVRKKYINDGELFLFDEGEEDDGTTYKDHRKIINLGGVNRKGWELGTVLAGAGDNRDEDLGYLINCSLPQLIAAGNNPGHVMRMS